MINWGIVVTKLTSRKFWTMLAGFISGVLVLVNYTEQEAMQIGGLITMFGSIVIYILAEAVVDKARYK